jgi:hypothetical protein
MYLVNKVCRVADTHERAARIDVILPTIQFLVVLERQVEPFVFCLKEQTIGLKVDPLYVCDISKVDSYRRGGGLEGMKM